MGLADIRRAYGVAATRGARIVYSPPGCAPKAGRITAARGSYIRVLFDGCRQVANLHPTWCVEYTEGVTDGD